MTTACPVSSATGRPIVGAGDHAAPASLDSPGLPENDRERPCRDEHRHDDVADPAEVEVVEERPEAAAQRELRGRHLEDLDRADDQRYGDGEARDRDVVVDLADRV